MNRLDISTFAVSTTPALGLLAKSGRSIEAQNAPTVHIGGDIPEIEAAIRNAGWRINKLESLDFLSNDIEPATAGCLILDTSWSVLQNRALQQQLSSLSAEVPFICVVEEVNLATVVALMKLGALDVVGKTFADETLINTIRLGLRNSENAVQKAVESRQLKSRYNLLSQRERQILTLISSGLMNKQVAGQLGISEITVKAHRGSVMRKMQARSFAGLVKMAVVLDI